MSATKSPLSSTWPIHWAVFVNNKDDLKRLLANTFDLKNRLGEKDPRGRSPLMLAVTLGHTECAKLLLEAGSNPNIEDPSGFNVLQESLTLGDHEFVADVLQRRDFHRYCSRIDGVPAALLRLRDTKDFYVEMKWEFTSWLPVVSSFCPSDTYKIYKRGSKVRFDTTLIGFDQNTWQRGSRSYVFSCDEGEARFMEFDHEARLVHVESMKTMDPNAPEASAVRQPDEMITRRMSSPMSITYLNTDKISFERAKAGLIGFRQDRTETINGYDCKVFYASPLEIVTKCRTEHLSPEDKETYKSSLAGKKAPFLNQLFGAESFFGETVEGPSLASRATVDSSRNRHNVTPEEYFDETVDLTNRDIGVNREISSKVQRFKALLWLCDQYPLSLQEQILPVVDLMAMSSGHFAKYRDFINLHLPTGFPVRIEIPLFRVLHAKITFGNIFALEKQVENVLTIKDETELACVIDDSIFSPPPGYNVIGNGYQRDWHGDEDMMQMALEQYLIGENGSADSVTFHEALQTQHDPYLQRAIEESLCEYNRLHCAEEEEEEDEAASDESPSNEQSATDNDIELAMTLSRQMLEQYEQRRREEEDILERVLKLSMTEK